MKPVRKRGSVSFNSRRTLVCIVAVATLLLLITGCGENRVDYNDMAIKIDLGKDAVKGMKHTLIETREEYLNGLIDTSELDREAGVVGAKASFLFSSLGLSEYTYAVDEPKVIDDQNLQDAFHFLGMAKSSTVTLSNFLLQTIANVRIGPFLPEGMNSTVDEDCVMHVFKDGEEISSDEVVNILVAEIDQYLEEAEDAIGRFYEQENK